MSRKKIHGYFKQQTGEIAHGKPGTWLEIGKP